MSFFAPDDVYWTDQEWASAVGRALRERDAAQARAGEMEDCYDRLTLDVARLTRERDELIAASQRVVGLIGRDALRDAARALLAELDEHGEIRHGSMWMDLRAALDPDSV